MGPSEVGVRARGGKPPTPSPSLRGGHRAKALYLGGLSRFCHRGWPVWGRFRCPSLVGFVFLRCPSSFLCGRARACVGAIVHSESFLASVPAARSEPRFGPGPGLPLSGTSRAGTAGSRAKCHIRQGPISRMTLRSPWCRNMTGRSFQISTGLLASSFKGGRHGRARWLCTEYRSIMGGRCQCLFPSETPLGPRSCPVKPQVHPPYGLTLMPTRHAQSEGAAGELTHAYRTSGGSSA